ncbi:hypothetical protein D3C84_565910 [compost metagenome]
MDRDQGHHRVAGRGKLPGFGAQVGDQASRTRMYLGVGQVQFGFLQGGGGAAQLGVVFLAAALLLARTLHFGASRGDLADGLLARGAGALQTAQGDGARVFPVEALEARAVLPLLQLIGLCGLQGRLRRVDAGGARADLPARRVEVGAGAIDGDLVLLAIHFEQHLAGLHVLVVAHQHPGHPAGYLGGDRDHEGLHPCLLGIGGEAVGQQVPEQGQDYHPGDPAGPTLHRVGGSGCRRAHWRFCGVLRGITHRCSPCAGPGCCPGPEGSVRRAGRPSRCVAASAGGWPGRPAARRCTSRRRAPCTG